MEEMSQERLVLNVWNSIDWKFLRKSWVESSIYYVDIKSPPLLCKEAYSSRDR